MKIFIEIYHPFYWHKDCKKISYMSVLIIKHVENEGPGLIEDCLKEEKIPYRILNLESGLHLPRPDDFNGIVILGGPMNVYEEDRYPFLKNEDLFIKGALQKGKSVLGICLGAQLIAKALGAKVSEAPLKEIGWYEVSLTEIGTEDPFFSKYPNTFPVFQWHQDTFEIPNAGKLIATSSSVPHQAFRYGKKVYGLQFHIEVTEEMIKEWLQIYEEELKGSQPPLFSKFRILIDTEINIENYTRRGMKFVKELFGPSGAGP